VYSNMPNLSDVKGQRVDNFYFFATVPSIDQNIYNSHHSPRERTVEEGEENRSKLTFSFLHDGPHQNL